MERLITSTDLSLSAVGKKEAEEGRPLQLLLLLLLPLQESVCLRGFEATGCSMSEVSDQRQNGVLASPRLNLMDRRQTEMRPFTRGQQMNLDVFEKCFPNSDHLDQSSRKIYI